MFVSRGLTSISAGCHPARSGVMQGSTRLYWSFVTVNQVWYLEGYNKGFSSWKDSPSHWYMSTCSQVEDVKWYEVFSVTTYSVGEFMENKVDATLQEINRF